MSTVILTPDYFGQDCTVVTNTYPQQQFVDPAYKKIFVSPDQRFMIGTVGKYRPEEIETPECFAMVERILDRVMEISPDNKGAFDKLDNDDDTKRFCEIFEKEQILLVTKDKRFLAFDSKKQNALAFIHPQSITGLGSGGDYGVGLLKGGMGIHDIWSVLHILDHYTSSAYKLISLSILQPWIKQD